jgi:hypothetical protein
LTPKDLHPLCIVIHGSRSVFLQQVYTFLVIGIGKVVIKEKIA